VVAVEEFSIASWRSFREHASGNRERYRTHRAFLGELRISFEKRLRD